MTDNTQPNNMVELHLADSVVVVTENGEQHMTLQELSQLINRGESFSKVLIKVDLSCQ